MSVNLTLVYEDARGEIYSILLPTGQELMLFHSHAGYLRGGHSHNVPETVMLLSGRLSYHKIVDDQEVIKELGPGDISINAPGQPHMGYFQDESWLVEWKLGGVSAGGFTTTDFEPFRKLVREKMAQ
jgi:quercetin dioxygenase-like cupin family protein